MARRAGEHEGAKAIRKKMRQIPYGDAFDPEFRRLLYSRYADDFLLSFTGPKEEAEKIKSQLGEFLRDTLKLELSQAKTLITHASTQAARFLGYEISVRYANDRISNGERTINGIVALRLPKAVLNAKCKQYEKEGKPIHRPELLLNSDYEIVSRYQSEYRGVVQYYLLAPNVYWLNRLHWTMEASLLKTLANKHKSSVAAMANKYKAETVTSHGVMKCLKVVIERGDSKKPLVAQFGGIPLRRVKTAKLEDQRPKMYATSRSELITRLLASECELCGSTDNCEVHHIRKLADLNIKGRAEKPLWVRRMAALRRKTLVVCRACHDAIHAGRAVGKPTTE